jgi:hypothetical protein
MRAAAAASMREVVRIASCAAQQRVVLKPLDGLSEREFHRVATWRAEPIRKLFKELLQRESDIKARRIATT